VTTKFTEDDFKANSASAPTGQPDQGRKQWSMSTLYAARPNPIFDTRAKAQAWNKRYSDTPKLQVDLEEFAETIAEPTPQEVEANWERLRKLSAEKPGLKVVDLWDRPD
jgi:hypothetical protein